MKSSNLAEQLVEFDAVIESLKFTPAPKTRIIAPQDVAAADEPARPARRARVGGIRISDQGLRGFRVF